MKKPLYRTSSFCASGECVAVAFHSSSFCAAGDCLEVARDGKSILVRDTKQPSQEPLRFTPEEWRAFLLGVKNGEFDL